MLLLDSYKTQFEKKKHPVKQIISKRCNMIRLIRWDLEYWHMTYLLTWPCAPHSFPLRCSLPGSVKDWVLRRHFGPLCPHCGCGRTRSSGWKVLPGVPCCCKPEEVSKPGSPYETDCKRSLETSFPIHWWPRLPRNKALPHLAESMRPGSKLPDF